MFLLQSPLLSDFCKVFGIEPELNLGSKLFNQEFQPPSCLPSHLRTIALKITSRDNPLMGNRSLVVVGLLLPVEGIRPAYLGTFGNPPLPGSDKSFSGERVHA